MDTININQPSRTPDRDALRLVLYLCGLQGDTLLDVTYWLCSKADRENVVVPIANEYRSELAISTQNFHNNLKQLRDKGLLEGSAGVYMLAPILMTCYGKRRIHFDLQIHEP